MDFKILVVDDDDSIRDVIVASLDQLPCEISTANSVLTAIEAIENKEFDLVITDKNMPHQDNEKEGGMAILKHIKENSPSTEMMVMTGFATVESAIEALKLGAFDYLLKPFSVEYLIEKVKRLIEYRAFINPQKIIQAYKTIQNQILQLADLKNDAQFEERIRIIDQQIDYLLQFEKESEQLLVEQREALALVAQYAEQLQENKLSSEQAELVDNIITQANKRI